MTAPKSNKDNIVKQKKCKCCFEEIHISATVCHHCGKHQNFWWRHFGDTAIIVSIIMVIISIAQMFGAYKQNIDASNALEKANFAAKDANRALAQVVSDANEIYKLKLVVENQGDQVVEQQKKFTLFNEFMMTVINAQNDARKSYDKLLEWSNDKSFMLNNQAWQAWKEITSKHYPIGYRTIPFPWKEGVDPSKLTLSDLKFNYQHQDALSFYKPALIEYIWKREDISKKERMTFLINVMKTDDSLTAVEYAGRFFAAGAGVNFHPLGVKEASKWWEENKDIFK